MRNIRIAQQLGMPHGTAAGRLRKIILFDLLKRHKENSCFKCGKPIEVVDDLSIEHKQPWEGISADLFWSLDNIAFSHLHCNRKDRSAKGCPNLSLRKVPPLGMNWCYRCKAFLPVAEFSVSKSRWTGFHTRCKKHQHDTR